MRTYVPMREFSFTLAEHDPDRPWIVLGREHQTVKLDAGVSFFESAREQWPEPRWTVELGSLGAIARSVTLR